MNANECQWEKGFYANSANWRELLKGVALPDGARALARFIAHQHGAPEICSPLAMCELKRHECRAPAIRVHSRSFAVFQTCHA
jgi:hypothetical protein